MSSVFQELLQVRYEKVHALVSLEVKRRQN